MATGSELGYNTLATATQMAQSIFGEGVTVTGASYYGDIASSAIYSNGASRAPGVVPGDTGVILSTGRADSFTQSSGDPNRSTGTSTNTLLGINNNAQFNALVGASTYDASILDVDFIPTGDVMTIRFVFSSEEYPEYSNSTFNDTVGVWINGTNVPVAVGNGAVSVGNVSQSNTNLFRDNTGDAYNTEMDGFTITMSLTIPVNSGVVNSIRIGIADVQDASYDSNLLIAGDSIQTTLVAADDTESLYPGGTRVLDVLANDTNQTGGTLTITHINGVAVNSGDSVTLPSGDTITLNADGTLTVDADTDADIFNFTYDIKSSTGQIDTGMVTVETIPCFVAGTMIRTPGGEVPVEALEPGDLVLTHDDGAQPLRWVGRRSVPAVGPHAPVSIGAGAFGDHDAIKLSPQHRILVGGSLAELLFGEAEVLVSAKDLVNDATVHIAEGGSVDYVHLLFDRHQVVYSAGLATESFLPGPMTIAGFEEEIVAEICGIFPELDPHTWAGYSAAARRTLKAFEARLLVVGGMAA